MRRVDEYYETHKQAWDALEWYKTHYPSSVLSIFEVSTKDKNLNTKLDKVWNLYGTEYGND